MPARRCTLPRIAMQGCGRCLLKEVATGEEPAPNQWPTSANSCLSGTVSPLDDVAPPARAQDPRYRGGRHGHAIRHALCLQPIARFLFDHQVDQFQPLVFAHCFGQQLPVTRVVVARVLLAHRTPPYARPRQKCFPSHRPAQRNSATCPKVPWAGRWPRIPLP